jgi:hypothetical protein
MDLMSSGLGGVRSLVRSELLLLMLSPLCNRVDDSGSPLSSSGRPIPSLKRARTSSERGSPGRTQPRFVVSPWEEWSYSVIWWVHG